MAYARLTGLLVAILATSAFAGSKEVLYVDIPKWVVPVPAPTETPTPAGAPIRIVHTDYQIYLGPDGDEIFNASRLKLLSPEALRAGNIAVAWSPDAGDVRVHYLRIIRDGNVIDVLKDTHFEVLRREGFLENAVLNGQLTATIQVPGLQVGDELEFAETVRHKDLTLGDHSFGFALLSPVGQPGAFRIRLIWPQARQIKWQMTKDVSQLPVVVKDGNKEIVYELRDPSMAMVTKGAPPRFNLRRLMEYSDFESWKDVSAKVWPLFDKASVLPKDSPVRQEVARIAASTKDPVARTEAALQLVQDRIRYVYVGLDGGNMNPAAVNDTWERRFGDCKAKTVLLLAILRELGIESEAVLVNSRTGDGINERLPNPGAFDHVVVRAKVGKDTYWLDGTRLGDKSLSALVVPDYRWVLPLRSKGTEIESVPALPPKIPLSISVLEFDASKGFEEKADIRAQQVFRGDLAFQLRSQLLAMSKDDSDRMLKRFWDETSSSAMDPDVVGWNYDEKRGTLRLTVTGKWKLEWEGDGSDRYMDLMGGGFTPPTAYRRPKDEDQSAPWAEKYPGYRCWVTSMRLPKVTDKKWDYSSRPVYLQLGGVTYFRIANLQDDTIRMVMAIRNDTPEISAAQAEEVNKKLPTFDNKMSRIFQIDATDKSSDQEIPIPPFEGDVDWTYDLTPCTPAIKVN